MTVLAFIVGVVIVVLGLGVSIALHEIGHLVPAKKFGVRVGQYMVGMGPTAWSKRVGETEYGVKWLPIGGYISMAGMYPSGDGKPARGVFKTLVQDAQDANEESREGVDDSRTFSALPTWKRVIIMLGGPVMNLVIAIVLFTVVVSGIGIPQNTSTVASVSQCVLPAGTDKTECAAGDPESPAAAAGLMPGDTIVAVDGTAVSDFQAASEIIRAHPDDTISVVVERDGGEETLTMTPVLATNQYVDADGELVTAEVGFAGFGPTRERVRQPVQAGTQQVFDQMGAVAGIIAQLPQRIWQTSVDMFTGQDRDPNGPISVIGVGRLAGEVAATEAPILDRTVRLIQLVGSVNIALFAFNMLPLLPLDGGHIVVALWDAIKRGWAKLRRRPRPRPADASRLVPLTLVVVVLMIGMSAVLFAADIFNPVTL
ncbi:M50 family metallopeptidase [Microbacterium sp. JB110]|uniref:M50 family metallopeptidase n=1 Tax=Microbacterium sp. JB110 TaxID=2024477 RepID=UPI000B353203|nr:M50 family metallopeptidase [Microbacterium sp. JB110]RCS57795.1 PDZ domain-containing protein [Microbacterium sp. JB110]